MLASDHGTNFKRKNVELNLPCQHIYVASLGQYQLQLARAKYNVLIYNTLMQLEVVALGDVAEMIVGFTENEIAELNNLNEAFDVDKMNGTLHGIEYIFQVRKRTTPIAIGTSILLQFSRCNTRY